MNNNTKDKPNTEHRSRENRLKISQFQKPRKYLITNTKPSTKPKNHNSFSNFRKQNILASNVKKRENKNLENKPPTAANKWHRMTAEARIPTIYAFRNRIFGITHTSTLNANNNLWGGNNTPTSRANSSNCKAPAVYGDLNPPNERTFRTNNQ
jgi:hypothetical protein